MIGFLKGRIIRASGSVIVVDVNNVGYKVIVGHIGILEGEEVELNIYTHVREQEISLYGFVDDKNMQIFELLLDVSGVGPKSAMIMVVEKGYKKIISGITQDNPAVLKAKGIGKKTAEKIIIELKNKVAKLKFEGLADEEISINDTEDSVYIEVVEALTALGYRKNEIDQAYKEIGNGDKTSTQDVIKLILSYLRK